jgi:hypothetical protein
MILSDARTRLLRLVDDDGSRWNAAGDNAELDDALKTAQEEVWLRLIESGAGIFEQEAAISSSSAGVVDLTTLKPIKIVALSLVASTSRLLIEPCRMDTSPTNAPGIRTLLITYVPRVSFPANAGAAFVWGHANVTATAIYDKLMCAIAASELKIKDGETNKALETRKTELLDAALRTIDIPDWTVMPLDEFSDDDRGSGLEYVATAPDTLQLVIA